MNLLGAFHRGHRRRGLAAITGPVLRPADAGYPAEIAGFNPAVTRRPGIVVGARSEDDVVAARLIISGRHAGEFLGVPPTDSQVTFQSHELFRVDDGRLVEQWVVMDVLGLMQQLGAIPAS